MQTPAKFGTGLKALVVDSSAESAAFISNLLQELGFQVATCSTIDQAISRWSESSSDLLFADLELSDGSGLSFVQWVLAATHDCSIVLTTSDATINSVIEALRLNVSDYILKPYQHTGPLSERLRRICENLALKRREKVLLADLQEKNTQLNNLTAQLIDKNRQLEALATKDITTGLNNHDYFMQRLNEELARAQQNGTELALILMDIDNFKQIHDVSGQEKSNNLLTQIAKELQNEKLASSIGVQSTIAARLGGDDFAILLPESNKLHALSLADALRQQISKITSGHYNSEITMSIGISNFPADAKNTKHFLEATEQALAIAKNNGKNQTIVYDKAFTDGKRDTRAQNNYLKLLQALERSIKNKAFNMLYQPIVSAKTLQPYGYEALVRPTDADIHSTYELFTTAMSSGMLYSLGNVLRDLSLNDLCAGLSPEYKMFVNLHPQEFSPALFKYLLKTFGSYAKQIVFEVTESEAIHDFTKLNRMLTPLREAGFLIALDDLGAGYSSLNTLIELKPDLAKLDLELLQNLDKDTSRAHLIHHILDYAAGEKMLVVAEGIETEQQRQIVTEMGCPLLQGFLVGRPSKPSWIK